MTKSQLKALRALAEDIARLRGKSVEKVAGYLIDRSPSELKALRKWVDKVDRVLKA